MSRYCATINVPGYLPMDDDPPIFETAAEAWEYLLSEREGSEDAAYDARTDPDFPEDSEYSETREELAQWAKWAGSGLVCDFETVGTITGPTPGYDGDHDLGLAYTVTEVPDHHHFYDSERSTWWCRECDTCTDYCEQLNPQ